MIFFSFVKDFCYLAVTSSFGEETLKSGLTSFNHPIDRDTTVLDWKEIVVRCQESVAYRPGAQPEPEHASAPSTIEESCVPPADVEGQPHRWSLGRRVL